MGARVFAHLDADPAAAHLVGYGRGRAGAQEGIEDEVARIGCNLDDSLQ